MPNNYVDAPLLRKYAVADEADLDEVFEGLAAAVSRMFDRECEVSDGFFLKASDTAAARTFKGNRTKYIAVGPYIPASITAVTYDGVALVLGRDDFAEQANYLVFPYRVLETSEIVVTARFGFPEIPPDIVQACIEQALMMWRRKDMAFAEISGVSAAVLTAQFSPTFEAVAARYRGMYSSNQFFA